MPKRVLVAYVPVLHAGYQRFFMKHTEGVEDCYVVDLEVVGEREVLRKEIRALNPFLVAAAIRAWGVFQNSTVRVLDKSSLPLLRNSRQPLLMPDDEVNRRIAARHFPKNDVEFDSVFLRWDAARSLAEHEVRPDRVISYLALDREMMGASLTEAELSSDWFRQVGGVLVKDEIVLALGHNHHLPTEHTPYLDGDPRGNFKRGVHLELSTAQHAEAGLIAHAAREGIALAGASLYITTFPCPPCAKLVAEAGICRVYYYAGYGILDSEQVLRSLGVEIVFVDMNTPSLP